MKKLFYPILFSCIMVVSACKKSSPDNNKPTDNTKFQLTQDSIYMIAQEDYYWNSSLPSYNDFNPRKYTKQSTDLLNFGDEIDHYTQLSANAADHNLPYEYDP